MRNYILEYHPALADEVLRVEADKALAQNWPFLTRHGYEQNAQNEKCQESV